MNSYFNLYNPGIYMCLCTKGDLWIPVCLAWDIDNEPSVTMSSTHTYRTAFCHRPLIARVCPHGRFLLFWDPWRKIVKSGLTVVWFSNILMYFHLRASQNQIHPIHGGSHSGSHSDP